MTIKATAHLLGLIGMAGVWLVPYRLWSVVVERRIGVPLTAQLPSLIAAATVLSSIGLSGFVAMDTLPRVFRCLWDGWCSATRAGGLLNLGMFGTTVLLVEVTWHVSSAFWRRWSLPAASLDSAEL